MIILTIALTVKTYRITSSINHTPPRLTSRGSFFVSPQKPPPPRFDTSRPMGGGSAEDFRKVGGGDCARGCYLLIGRVGRFWGPECTERRGRYRPELECFQGQIIARKALQAEASAPSGQKNRYICLKQETVV